MDKNKAVKTGTYKNESFIISYYGSACPGTMPWEVQYVRLIDSEGVEVEWWNAQKCDRGQLGPVGNTITLSANRYGYPGWPHKYWQTLRHVRGAVTVW